MKTNANTIEEITSLLTVASRNWSFYAFIFISPVTFFLYIATFKLPENISGIYPALLSYLCFLFFFIISVHGIRGNYISNDSLSKTKLAKSLIAHSFKMVLCVLPFQFLGLIVLHFIELGRNVNKFDDFSFSTLIILLPISFILSMWLLAGYSYVVFKGNSIQSIIKSFAVLKERFAPICIITLVGLFCISFSTIGQSLLPFLSRFWLLVDIIAMYINLVLFIIGISYISKSLLTLNSNNNNSE